MVHRHHDNAREHFLWGKRWKDEVGRRNPEPTRYAIPQYHLSYIQWCLPRKVFPGLWQMAPPQPATQSPCVWWAAINTKNNKFVNLQIKLNIILIKEITKASYNRKHVKEIIVLGNHALWNLSISFIFLLFFIYLFIFFGSSNVKLLD